MGGELRSCKIWATSLKGIIVGAGVTWGIWMGKVFVSDVNSKSAALNTWANVYWSLWENVPLPFIFLGTIVEDGDTGEYITRRLFPKPEYVSNTALEAINIAYRRGGAASLDISAPPCLSLWSVVEALLQSCRSHLICRVLALGLKGWHLRQYCYVWKRPGSPRRPGCHHRRMQCRRSQIDPQLVQGRNLQWPHCSMSCRLW